MRRAPSWAIFVISIVVGAALTTCVRTLPTTLPPTPPLPSPFAVPAGCLELQAGTWSHAEDPQWRYTAEDDGGQLTLTAHPHVVVDAGFSPRLFRRDAGVDAGAPDAGESDAGDEGTLPPPRIELFRTDAGFLGQTLASVRHPTGRLCELRFPTRVLACDGGLWLEADDTAAVGDGCQAPANPGPPGVRQHHLLQLGKPAPVPALNDAGRDP